MILDELIWGWKRYRSTFWSRQYVIPQKPQFRLGEIYDCWGIGIYYNDLLRYQMIYCTVQCTIYPTVITYQLYAKGVKGYTVYCIVYTSLEVRDSTVSVYTAVHVILASSACFSLGSYQGKKLWRVKKAYQASWWFFQQPNTVQCIVQ